MQQPSQVKAIGTGSGWLKTMKAKRSIMIPPLSEEYRSPMGPRRTA